MARQTETPGPARQAAQTRAIDAILSGAGTEGATRAAPEPQPGPRPPPSAPRPEDSPHDTVTARSLAFHLCLRKKMMNLGAILTL